MTALLKQEKLLESNDLRNQLIERTEVLAKVKELFLIPGLEMMTMNQVSEFYEVEPASIRKVWNRHHDEIAADGVKKMTGGETLGHIVTVVEKRGNLGFLVTLADGSTTTLSTAPNILFSPRAILRIGMLLRDSEIAKEVRTQLLNTFETTTEQQRTEAIDQEDKLLLAVLHAKDTASSAAALAEYKRFVDRHIEKLEAKVDDLEAQLSLVAEGTVTWGYRPMANALIRAIAGAAHCPIPYVYGRTYRQMEYALGIKLSLRKPHRKDDSLLSRIRESEWPAVLRLIGSLAVESGVDIAKCINSINAKNLTE